MPVFGKAAGPAEEFFVVDSVFVVDGGGVVVDDGCVGDGDVGAEGLLGVVGVGFDGVVGVEGFTGFEGFDGVFGLVGVDGFAGCVGFDCFAGFLLSFGSVGFGLLFAASTVTVALSQLSGAFAAVSGMSAQAVFLTAPFTVAGAFAVIVKLTDCPGCNSAIVYFHLLSFSVPALALVKVIPAGALSVTATFLRLVSPLLVTLIW